MMWFVIWLLSCLATGAVASKLERSFGTWFCISFFLSPIIGMPTLLIFGSDGKQCPECSETVKQDANVCKHCKYDFRKSVAGKQAALVDTVLENHKQNRSEG